MTENENLPGALPARPAGAMLGNAAEVDEFTKTFIDLIPPNVEAHTGFRVRFRVRQDKFVRADEPTASFRIDGRDVTLSSRNPNEPLNSQDLIINARGFATEEAASTFAENLRAALVVRSAARRTGIDLGEDRPTAWLANDIKAAIKRQTGISIRDDVHGGDVFFEDGKTVYHSSTVTVSVSIPAEDFVPDINGSFNWVRHVEPVLLDAARLLNVADLQAPPIVKLSLSAAAIEALTPAVPWSAEAKALLDDTIGRIENEQVLAPEEQERLIGSLQSIRDFGLSGGRRVRAHLENIAQQGLSAELAPATKTRGKLLHGKYVGREELQTAAEAARNVAQKIFEIALTEAGVSPEALRGPT